MEETPDNVHELFKRPSTKPHPGYASYDTYVVRRGEDSLNYSVRNIKADKSLGSVRAEWSTEITPDTGLIELFQTQRTRSPFETAHAVIFDGFILRHMRELTPDQGLDILKNLPARWEVKTMEMYSTTLHTRFEWTHSSVLSEAWPENVKRDRNKLYAFYLGNVINNEPALQTVINTSGSFAVRSALTDIIAGNVTPLQY